MLACSRSLEVGDISHATFARTTLVWTIAPPPSSYLIGPGGSAFGERATAVCESRGMKVTESDNPGILNRFAVSDDGFRFSVRNEPANQVYIGGSGPCIESPDGVL